jgi:nucleotide-binding universal stress UspA family protein
MNEQSEELTIRRILVAVDASHHSLAALEAAAELAASMKAELQGIYVEDVNLIKVAGAPGAREVRYPYIDAGRLNRQRMERQLRAQAAQARRALMVAGERRQVKWSFRVVRGEVAHEVLAAAVEADVLSLGKVSRPFLRRIRLGSTALAAAVQGPCCVLLLHKDATIGPPVAVTYDGSPVAERALRLAARLARQNGGYLLVLVVAGTPEEEYRLQAGTADWLRKQGILIRYRGLKEASTPALLQALQAERTGTLVLSGSVLHLAPLQKLLHDVECPVLLVR